MMKDCRTFVNLQGAFGAKQNEAQNPGFTGAPGSVALNIPPPLLPASGAAPTLKGLHQGNPLSPILFNIVAYILAILIARGKEDGQIGGLVPHLVDRSSSILYYVDDTILFMEHDLAKAVYLKSYVFLNNYLFKKINCHKSKIFYFGKAKEVEND
jgi:hypothetical protein